MKTKKEFRKSSITKNQRFRSLVQQAITNKIEFDSVLADSWFGAKGNMEFIHCDLKKAFIFGIKANRLIAFSQEERKKGQYQNLKALNLEDNEKKLSGLKLSLITFIRNIIFGLQVAHTPVR